MKPTSITRFSDILTVLLFIAIYVALFIAIYSPIVGYPFLLGLIFLGAQIHDTPTKREASTNMTKFRKTSS